MTSGSDLEIGGNSDLVNGKVDKKQEEMHDSGHSSVATPDNIENNAADEKPSEKLVKIIIQPTAGESFDFQVSDNELVQEIYQTLYEREATCHRTCFSLALNGKPIDAYAELRSIPGFTDGCTLTVVDENYTIREARLHIRQVRELLKHGISTDAHDQPCTTESAQAYLPTINLQPESNEKKDLKQDYLPPDYILPGGKDRSLSHLLVTPQKSLIAVKNISISPFNPPPGPRRLRGDILYIDVESVENRTIYVTCCTKGFYINNSQDGVFDPSQSNAYKTIYHSLVELLQVASPGFKKIYPMIIKRKSEKPLVERLATYYPTASWVAQGLRPDSYSNDSFRAHEQTEPFRVGFEDHMPGFFRDWNDEIQSCFEMPKKHLSERILRDRNHFKVHADYINAAVKGAQAIVDGNVLAINLGEDKKTHMYIWSNIFYSLGFDVKDHYKELGGDAAAFAATSIDLQSVRSFSMLDDPKLHTLGMAIFDYRGYRVTAQTIIPGILEREQEQSVVYGSIDFGKTVVSDERYHELLEDTAKQLKILPHTVITNENGEEKSMKLYTSYEAKGIVGNDGRKYILDLLRTMPPDVHFLENCKVSETAKQMGFPRKFPHQLSSLRRELIDIFYEAKLVDFIQFTAKMIRSEINDAKEKNDENRLKLANEAESELSRVFVDISEDREFTCENSLIKEAITKGAAAVNSVRSDRFEIRFNPDCFSLNVKHAPSEDIEKQQKLVIEVCEFLLLRQIPELVTAFKDCSLAPIDGETLSELMHQRGINIRYLGEVAKKLDMTNSFARPLVLSEIVVRCAKHVLREIMYQTTLDQTTACFSRIFNCLFSDVSGESDNVANKKGNKKGGKKKNSYAWSTLNTSTMWKNICEEAANYYGYSIDVDSLEKFTEIHYIQKTSLLRRICKVMGVQIVAKDYQLDNGKKNSHFTEDDFVNIYPVIKHHQPFSADAKKLLLRGHQAMQIGAPREAYDCIGESFNIMNAVYGVMHPEMPQALRSLARISHVLGDTGDAINHQHKATVMSERMFGLDSGKTIVEYINLAHFAFAALLIPGSLRPLYRARYLMNLVFGEKHPIMAQIDANIGVVLFAIQEFDLALKFLQSAHQIGKAIDEPLKMKSGLITNLIARAQAALGDFRAALVSEKETYVIFKKLFGEQNKRTLESGEYLKTLIQQAVAFQKKMMDANNSLSLSQIFQVQTPSVSTLFEILNVINGIMIVGLPTFQTIQNTSGEGSSESEEGKKQTVAAQIENEKLD